MPDFNDGAADSETLLILMPGGRNAEYAAALLTRFAVKCRICTDLDALCAAISPEIGAVLVADEAVLKVNLEPLSDLLVLQPAWSDLPFVVLTRSDVGARRSLAETHLPEALGNVVFLEYPLNTLSLFAAVRSAFRARRRQRLMGRYLAEQQLAAAALRESEARFRHMADSAPALIWVTDAAARIVFVNRHHGQVFGRGVAEIVHDGWTRIVMPRARRPLRTAFLAAFNARANFSAETQVRDKDGRVRWLRCEGVPRLDNTGRFRGYTGCALDITETRLATQELEQRVAKRTYELSIALERLHAEVTERQQAEKALRHSQKMEAIGQLTGGIAHDFNNMLQGIIGCLDLIDRRMAQGRSADIEPYINGARRSADSAAALTRRLLAFARRQTLLPASLQPAVLVRGMEEMIRRTVGPEIKVVVQAGNGPWNVRCDANELENALLNLCINARDAMPDGGTLTIETTNWPLSAADLCGEDDIEPGEFVRISVTDTGLGMTAEVLARAFEPFFTTKPFGQGTGLGLSQLYGFVQQSGGFVQMLSEPGIGTTVHIHLPQNSAPDIVDNQPLDDLAPGSAAETGVLPNARSSILVVEDERDVSDLIAQALRELEYQVVVAADGNAGLRVVQSQVPIDLLVTDVGLPGLNGRQLADAVRELRPDLPVLLITGYPGEAFEDQGICHRIDVLGKPFTLTALADRVRLMLRRGALADV